MDNEQYSYIKCVRRNIKKYMRICRTRPKSMAMSKDFYEGLLKEVEEKMPLIFPAVRDDKMIFAMKIIVADTAASKTEEDDFKCRRSKK